MKVLSRPENKYEAARMKKENNLDFNRWSDIYQISDTMVQVMVISNSGLSYYNFYVDDPKEYVWDRRDFAYQIQQIAMFG